MSWDWSNSDSRQFTIDRIDSNIGHTKDNVMLTCLECNRKRTNAIGTLSKKKFFWNLIKINL